MCCGAASAVAGFAVAIMKMVYIVVIYSNNRDNHGIFVVTDSKNNNYSNSSNM
jgi:hypothetical protein